MKSIIFHWHFIKNFVNFPVIREFITQPKYLMIILSRLVKKFKKVLRIQTF